MNGGAGLDPVLSLLVGALGAAVIGLLGAWIQSRREHRRWVRERRFEAHLAFLRICESLTEDGRISAMTGEFPRSLGTPQEVRELMVEITDGHAAVMLLGPDSLERAAAALRDEAAECVRLRSFTKGYEEARVAYISASRSALAIR
ncbi:hypothetical protein [Pseudolysinimonas sp.]|jgi:hypothetical protein|uniref:hypothetical protein n=1 Tax=Pseudolysinimonas sp. TaxID=2680009 RepID=UPI0037841A2E